MDIIQFEDFTADDLMDLAKYHCSRVDIGCIIDRDFPDLYFSMAENLSKGSPFETMISINRERMTAVVSVFIFMNEETRQQFATEKNLISQSNLNLYGNQKS